MKPSKLLAAFSTLLQLVCFAAQPEKVKRPMHDAGGPPVELFKQFDKNGDRKLDNEERQAMQKVYATLSKLDKNHDGEIDQAEVTPPQHTGDAKMHNRSQAIELLKKADMNGNHSIDPDEVEMLQDILKKSGAAILAKLDQNGNGKLEPSEIERLNDRMGRLKGAASAGSSFKHPPEKGKASTVETTKPAETKPKESPDKGSEHVGGFKDKSPPNSFGN
jgi:Ca2+-binding EF-hand superfamily protein